MSQYRISIGLSKRKHLPVWKLGNHLIAPWQLTKLYNTAKDYRILTLALNCKKILRYGDLYRINYFGKDLLLDEWHILMLLKEMEIWEQYYLPISVQGKTVLDAGAGCGETAVFYLAHGAAKVISVELDQSVFSILERNVKTNHLNVELHNESFSEKFISSEIDFAKIDAEGSEISLLKLDRIDIPCLVETHSRETTVKICRKFSQFRKLYDLNKDLSFIVNR